MRRARIWQLIFENWPHWFSEKSDYLLQPSVYVSSHCQVAVGVVMPVIPLNLHLSLTHILSLAYVFLFVFFIILQNELNMYQDERINFMLRFVLFLRYPFCRNCRWTFVPVFFVCFHCMKRNRNWNVSDFIQKFHHLHNTHNFLAIRQWQMGWLEMSERERQRRPLSWNNAH